MMDDHAATEQLHTIADWLRWAATRFGESELYYGHGTDGPWDEAVALLTGLLRLPEDRLQVLLQARLLPAERERLAVAVRQRIEQRVPLPYLTGIAHYGGLQFGVDRSVLIPRSPIQELLQEALQPWLGTRYPRRILDLCCGSGCIGILAACCFPEAEVVLSDLSEAALTVARDNVIRHGLQERVQVCHSDLCAGLPEGAFDLVLCNPPYVDAADMAELPPEFAHEPRLALEAGHDGLDLVRRLLSELPSWLAADGLLVLEVGNSAPALQAAWPELGWVWPELERGGFGVALLEAAELVPDRA